MQVKSVLRRWLRMLGWCRHARTEAQTIEPPGAGLEISAEMVLTSLPWQQLDVRVGALSVIIFAFTI